MGALSWPIPIFHRETTLPDTRAPEIRAEIHQFCGGTVKNLFLHQFLYPTGAGETRQITHDKIDHYSFAWLPDGKASHLCWIGAGTFWTIVSDGRGGWINQPHFCGGIGILRIGTVVAGWQVRTHGFVLILSPASFGSTAATRVQFRACSME